MILMKTLLEEEDIETHLRNRGLDPDLTKVIIDKESGLAVFLLYNLSGQLVGYQRYNPKGVKQHTGDEFTEKYYTWVTKEDRKVPKLAVWGLETVFEHTKWFFVTEGIFDCIKLHNAGYPALAVLANNPKPLKGWLKTLGKTVVAVADNDQAGNKLKSLADFSISAPAPYKDLGEMPQEEVNTFIKSAISQIPVEKPEDKYPPHVKDSHYSNLLNQKIVNPETNNKILVKTALAYPEKHPARIAAIRFIDNNGETVSKAANRGSIYSENKRNNNR